jgi:large subunit ribosomal protein L4e
MSRPTLNVFNLDGNKAGTVELPKVFNTPIRPELVRSIYTNVSKNSMQPVGTDPLAGVRVSAISWGPGRAKARVPRVNGSGSNRNGQGAYANFCRGGHRFGAPTVMRRWFRAVPIKQRRYAIASAIAATAVTAFVQARGHKIDNVPEIPLVAADAIEGITKTRDAVAALKALKLYDDVARVLDNKVHRSSKGKMRRSAYKNKRGPLVIFANDNGVSKAFRNIPGVDVLCVTRLSLAALAPAATLGRLCVWSESAIKALDGIYESKKGFTLPRSLLTNADVDKIAHSDEVLSVLRQRLAPVTLPKVRCEKRLNPAYDEWQNALKEIKDLQAQEYAKKNEPAELAALFKDVTESQPEVSENLSVRLYEFQPIKNEHLELIKKKEKK